MNKFYVSDSPNYNCYAKKWTKPAMPKQYLFYNSMLLTKLLPIICICGYKVNKFSTICKIDFAIQN